MATSPLPPVPTDGMFRAISLGPTLIVGVVEALLQGILLDMSWWYLMNARREQRIVLAIVIYLFFASLAQTALSLYNLWSLFVTHFGDWNEAMNFRMFDRLATVYQASMAAPVQAYYIRRVFKVCNRKRWVIVVLGALLCGSWGVAVSTTYRDFQTVVTPSFSNGLCPGTSANITANALIAEIERGSLSKLVVTQPPLQKMYTHGSSPPNLASHLDFLAFSRSRNFPTILASPDYTVDAALPVSQLNSEDTETISLTSEWTVDPRYVSWLLSTAFLDCIVTVVILRYLLRNKKRNEDNMQFASGQEMSSTLKQLIHICWEAAVPPAAMAVITCIMYLSLRSTPFNFLDLACEQCLGKLYFISLMITLNSRISINATRTGLTYDVSAVHLMNQGPPGRSAASIRVDTQTIHEYSDAIVLPHSTNTSSAHIVSPTTPTKTMFVHGGPSSPRSIRSNGNGMGMRERKHVAGARSLGSIASMYGGVYDGSEEKAEYLTKEVEMEDRSSSGHGEARVHRGDDAV